MLQIISGKFFDSGKVNELESDAILYSNYSWVAPIKTIVAELRPVDAHGSRIGSYALRYMNRYQPRPPKDIMFLSNGDEAVEQFRLLASFHFQSFFHIDRSYVETLCRTQAAHSFDRTIPKAFVPKFFDLAKSGLQPEAAEFPKFVEKVIAMPRKQYRLLISCLAGFFEALEGIGKNFDLAYSVMVYMLEALSKTIVQPSPVWEDYDQNIRSKLDKELSSVDPPTADRVRAVLLNNPHLKLKKRFVNFISTHITDNYFKSEAEGLRFSLAKSETGRALGNLYDARSGYVHELKQVQKHLKQQWIADGDVFHWNNDPYLTFAGLVRLARHVLSSFIDRQPSVEHEEYSWREEIPGIIQLPLAPEYWVGHPKGFRSDQAGRRFSGFIEHLLMHYSKARPAILDLRLLMERIEALAATAKATERLPMLALYWMFNAMISPTDRRPHWETFLDRWRHELEQCSIEIVVIHVVMGHPLPWPPQDCATAFKKYQGLRFNGRAIRLPLLAELAVMGAVANLFLESKEVSMFQSWIDQAILDAAGNKAIQDYLLRCREEGHRIDVQHVLGRPLATDAAHELSEKKPTDVLEEDIRFLAYLKWEAAGRPPNSDIRFWLEAERELRPS